MSVPYQDPFLFLQEPYTSYAHEVSHVSNKDKSFLLTTSRLAYASTNRFRIACLVVRSGSVLGYDVNFKKVTPATPPNRFSTHAEIRAIDSVNDPQGSTVYIARLKLNNTKAIAKPCSWCMEYLITNGVYRVVYTVDEQSSESFYTSTVKWKH